MMNKLKEKDVTISHMGLWLQSYSGAWTTLRRGEKWTKDQKFTEFTLFQEHLSLSVSLHCLLNTSKGISTSWNRHLCFLFRCYLLSWGQERYFRGLFLVVFSLEFRVS